LLGQAGALDAARFKSVASTVGLDRSAFDPCVDREQTRDRIGLALEETRRYDLPEAAASWSTAVSRRSRRRSCRRSNI
jgi:hypothetical protein